MGKDVRPIVFRISVHFQFGFGPTLAIIMWSIFHVHLCFRRTFPGCVSAQEAENRIKSPRWLVIVTRIGRDHFSLIFGFRISTRLATWQRAFHKLWIEKPEILVLHWFSFIHDGQRKVWGIYLLWDISANSIFYFSPVGSFRVRGSSLEDSPSIGAQLSLSFSNL